MLRPTAVRLSSTLISAPARSTTAQRVNVASRSVLSLTGRDTLTLLQGLVTADVRVLKATPCDPVYAAFLQPAGRLIAPVFFHRALDSTEEEPRLLLDVHAGNAEGVQAFIKRFKLRSKVKLEDVTSAYAVQAGWGADAQDVPREEGFVAGGLDRRTPAMGWRRIVQGAATVNQQDIEAYTIHRLLQGVPDGPEDMPEGSSLPLEANVDWMGGVDYRKGCYVGQELTARTHHTGVVRKRIVPVSLYLPENGTPSTHELDASFNEALPPPGTDVRSQPVASSEGCAPVPRRGRPSGRLLSSFHNIGLALLRLEQVHKVAAGELKMTVQAEGGKTLGVRPWLPYWWPEEGKVRSEEGSGAD